MSFIIVYITYSNEKEAKKIAMHLLKKKLVACANIFPIKSLYWWKGKIQGEKEVVCIVKTKKQNWKKVKYEVKKIHPYECPCIMKINVGSNKEFNDWIIKESK